MRHSVYDTESHNCDKCAIAGQARNDGRKKVTEILNSDNCCEPQLSTFQNDNNYTKSCHPELGCLLLPKTCFRAKWPLTAGSQSITPSPNLGEGRGEVKFRRFFASLRMTGKKKYAFTLAEVLITLGIIGVVAAMTMPTLVAKYQEKETATKLKKVYSVLSNAYLLTSEANGAPDQWGMTEEFAGTDNHIKIAEKFLPYLKLSKNCIGKSQEEVFDTCFASDTLSSPDAAAILVLDNGTSVAFRNYSGTCINNYGGNKQLSNICAQIAVDINGVKKPNSAGTDKFNFYLTKYGIFPAGTAMETKVSFDSFCTKTRVFNQAYEGGFRNGDGCTAWIIYNENMDYLHCDDLSWDGKTKCN